MPDSSDTHESTDLHFTPEQYAVLHMMGHELRTPLNSIVGTCEMLVNAKYGELSSSQQKAAERVYRNGNRLSEMISTVMLYLRVAADAFTLQSQPLSLTQLLNDAIQKCHQAVNKPNVEWITDFTAPDNARIVHGDSEYLSLLIEALLMNAAHYTIEGHIRVTLHDVDPDHYRIQVEDSGIGVSKDDMMHIFHPFWRSVEAKALFSSGTGLGLLTATIMASRLKGTFTFQSEWKVGSKAELKLPVIMPM